MKICLHAFAMCQSMFCAIPFPGNIWDEKAREKMLLFLPIIGLEIGAVWFALSVLCARLALPSAITGLVLCAWPYFAAGWMHLDGFMDVTDAVRSWQSPQRRQEILKDSHVGSFAVIGVIFLILAQYVLLTVSAEKGSLPILLLIPAVSRCGSAIAVALLQPMISSQYAGRARSAILWVVPAGMLAVFLTVGFLFWGKYGFALLGCLAGYALALGRGYRALQGMNGDIAGYALTVGELCAVAILALI